MARPNKNQVDYFPHFVKGGKTLYILESLYGNDGYAFWFKLLELLCMTENQCLDYDNIVNREFLLAKTHLSEEKAVEIIEKLVELGQIDAELWAQKKVWIQNLVDNLSYIYERRKSVIPTKEQFLDAETMAESSLCEQKPISDDIFAEQSEVNVGINSQSKVKESKVNKSIYTSFPQFPYEEICRLWNTTCTSLPKVQKLSDWRRSKIRCRLLEWSNVPDQTPETTMQVWMATAEAIFEQMEKSDFLRGASKGSTWRASFDWLFSNSTNWVKVLEGNYSNSKNTNSNDNKEASNSRRGYTDYTSTSADDYKGGF